MVSQNLYFREISLNQKAVVTCRQLTFHGSAAGCIAILAYMTEQAANITSAVLILYINIYNSFRALPCFY